MKKKLLLLLLPLTLGMVSCGKDVDAKMKKVDLARLLNQEEISIATEKINENLYEKLSKCEINTAEMETDLINESEESSSTALVEIYSNEYATYSATSESKVKRDFYTYSNKEVVERKTAAFGNYYLTYTESYNDGQKGNKYQNLSYQSKNYDSVVPVIMEIPFSSLSSATIGVDKKDNIYAVSYSENVQTIEGRDKNGKDAVFKTKTTFEISGKFGNLKDPKAETFKTVHKVETNFDQELKVYSDYKLVASQVCSYKFEYKSRGGDFAKDNFIESLPDVSIQSANVVANVYSIYDTDIYYQDYSQNLNLTSIKKDFTTGFLSAKCNNFKFDNGSYYSFTANFTKMTIDKVTEQITVAQGGPDAVILADNNYLTSVSVSGIGKLYFLSPDIPTYTATLDILVSYLALTISFA